MQKKQHLILEEQIPLVAVHCKQILETFTKTLKSMNLWRTNKTVSGELDKHPGVSLFTIKCGLMTQPSQHKKSSMCYKNVLLISFQLSMILSIGIGILNPF